MAVSGKSEQHVTLLFFIAFHPSYAVTLSSFIYKAPFHTRNFNTPTLQSDVSVRTLHPRSVQVADIPKVSRQEAHKHNRSQSVYSRWMSPEQESHRHPKPSHCPNLWPSDSVESFYSPAPATWGHDHMLGPHAARACRCMFSVSVFLTSLLLVTHTFFSQWSFLACFHVLKWL